jgi:MFS transporter, DHA3 family, macrolide efflux protein
MTSAAPAAQFTIRQVLAIPPFRRLWTAQFISIFGDFVALYAVYSMVSFRLNGTPRDVSLITIAFLLPLAFLGPLAGVLVDRWDARRTMIFSDAARAVLVLLLVFAGSLWQVYGILLAMSALSAFFLPAQSVTTPLIVPREALVSASAAMQQAMQIVRIASPVVAGAMVGWFGETSCYYLDAGTFLISAAIIATIHPVLVRAPANLTLRSTIADLQSGVRFIFGHPVVGFVIASIAAGTFAIACFSALIAVYVRDVLKAEAMMFGILGSLVGVGMLAGGVFVAGAARRSNRKERLVLFGLLGVGVFILVIASAGDRVVTMICCAAIGAAAAFIIIPAGALMQSETPHEIRGRVSSSSASLIALSQGIALLFAGDLGARFGIVPVYFGSGLILLAVASAGFLRLRHTHR